MFHKPLGTRHPINLVMDLTSKIFEEIGYEVLQEHYIAYAAFHIND